jgi:uncharacterized protein
MEQLNYKLQIKSLDEQGRFTGLASVYNNVDYGGDVVEPGAFQKTIADRGGEVPLLFHHDTTQPIGLARLQDTNTGLAIDGQLVLEVPKARETYALMKARALRGLSIGYGGVKSVMISGVRHLRELKLFEVSVVPVPMNEMALVNGVKSGDSDIAEQVKAFRAVVAECRKGIR